MLQFLPLSLSLLSIHLRLFYSQSRNMLEEKCAVEELDFMLHELTKNVSKVLGVEILK